MTVKTAVRRRAPSKKSLETKAKILDIAEELFSRRGFDGTSIRDIAKAAGVQVALVHHHGGPKEDLFHLVVARRAKPLAELRQKVLADKKADVQKRGRENLTLREILSCFVLPFLELTLSDKAEWPSYGRLIALVSADERWRAIAEECFDPTAAIFLDEIAALLPDVSRTNLSAAFVFTVSGMLALTSSSWRIGAVARQQEEADLAEALLDYSEAGFLRLCGKKAAAV
ncbi:TetR family transcriptional regulator [Roseibium sp.]|uniref:TetR/AcrR family transcriptional regulator n=1 Tax=Roseibium sp. TaxID=1936156 RepID=UPI003B52E3B8